jgi:VIT1/CCC1 family predicted Fe2+/Mn2+ transporter
MLDEIFGKSSAMKESSPHKDKLLIFQRNEITEYHIYIRLARIVKGEHNRTILNDIAEDELRHYHIWKKHTGCDIKPNKFRLFKYALISHLFGFTFAIKLMEKGEAIAQANYRNILDELQDSEAIARDENEHEIALIRMLDEERLRYVGSIVLGLNDALVELTAALTGLTFALQNTQIIALTGSITGLAAALSMAVSEYLSTKTEDTEQNPVKAAIYTGSAYVITVVLLIMPYLIFKNFYVCLLCSLTIALLIIAFFNYYISVAQEVPFKKRFLEMAGLSLAVSAISFLIGFALRKFTGIEL